MTYREQELPLPDGSPERLEHLAAQKKSKLPSFSDVWEGPSPDEDFEAARAEWEASRRALIEAEDPSEEALTRFFSQTTHLHNLAGAEDGRALSERALEAQTLGRFAASHRSDLSIDAAKRGDLAEARRWLTQCDPRPDDLLADSAYRFGVAFVALEEGDAERALACLGESWRAVTFHNTYRILATFHRAYALQRLGRGAEAAAELRAAANAVGVPMAERVLHGLPERWTLDGSAIYDSVRRAGVSGATAKLVGGALAWLVSAGLVVIWSFADPPFAVDRNTTGVIIAAAALALLGTYFAVVGWRTRRVGSRGAVVSGTVTGRIATVFRSNRQPMCRLRVAFEEGGETQEVESHQIFGPSEGLVGSPVWIIRHASSRRASVVLRDAPP